VSTSASKARRGRTQGGILKVLDEKGPFGALAGPADLTILMICGRIAFALRNDLVRLWRKDLTTDGARVKAQKDVAVAFALAGVRSCASVFGCRERFDNQKVLWYSDRSLKGTLTTEE
jgi:hypothetical protein